MRRAAATLLALGLSSVACRKPPPPDPAEVAYRRAVEMFARFAAQTHDLTYRDPRFDNVLAALALVPAGDPLRAKADALAREILAARRQATDEDAKSAGVVAKALAPAPFVPAPHDAPFPTPPAAPAGATGAGAPQWSGGGWEGASSEATPLPDWYRKAGYLGLGRRPPSPASSVPPPVVAASPPAAPAPAQRPSAAPPPRPQPAIYGLPGPAGRALGGRP